MCIRDRDISAVTFAARYTLDNSKALNDVQIVYGGVGPVVKTLTEVSDYLNGKKVETQVLDHARSLVDKNITPIGDVRGSEKFRRIVSKNLMDKFFHEISQEHSL